MTIKVPAMLYTALDIAVKKPKHAFPTMRFSFSMQTCFKVNEAGRISSLTILDASFSPDTDAGGTASSNLNG